jgi:hypothetical protein
MRIATAGAMDVAVVHRSRTDLDGPAARFTELVTGIVGNIRRRPLGSLAVALGVGFVVGGALSFRIGRLTLAAAARHIGRELLKQVL